MNDRSASDGHVFDQTNGVLGEEPEAEAREQRGETSPPRSFGVPPLTSL